MTLANLCQNMIHFDAVGFSECCSEEVMFLLTLGVYRVSQKMQNGGFSVHCERKVLYIYISLDRASSAEENGT